MSELMMNIFLFFEKMRKGGVIHICQQNCVLWSDP